FRDRVVNTLKSRTAEAQPGQAGDVSDQAISRRRQALSGVGRGAESTMRAQAVAATTIAPITAMACCQPPADMPMCARPRAAWYPAPAAGTAKRGAIAARIRGERSVVKAICPAIRVMLLAIAPTIIAPIGPEPLSYVASPSGDTSEQWKR